MTEDNVIDFDEQRKQKMRERTETLIRLYGMLSKTRHIANISGYDLTDIEDMITDIIIVINEKLGRYKY